MKAVVMAGGEGTRLRPLTSNQPKPMVPIVGKPCMEHVIDLLRRHGVDDIVVTLAFMPQAIRSYFGDGSAHGVRIRYSVEETPAGTAGSVKLAEEELDEPFLVISGDALCDIDLTALIRAHEERESVVTIALKSVDNPLEFGIVVTDSDGRIERFLEKPSWSQVFTDTINTGIYVMDPEALRNVPTDEPYDFSKQLFPLLLEKGRPMYGHVVEGYWKDIGNLDQYREANFDALDERVQLEIPGSRLRGNVWVGEGVELGDVATVQGPAFIGTYCRIHPEASVGAYTVLSQSVVLREHARVARSILDASTYVGRRAVIEGAVVGRMCDIRSHVRIGQNAAIGDQTTIGDDAVVAPGVRVYPFKDIEAGTHVDRNVIWEARTAASIFGRERIRGLVNVDLTPETALRLGMALGTALKRGARVVTSREADTSARLLRRAVFVGLNAAGVDVSDLRVMPAAVNRHLLKLEGYEAGLHVGPSADDPEAVEIQIFEPPGVQASSAFVKKVENHFGRQDFRRAAADEVGEIRYPAQHGRGVRPGAPDDARWGRDPQAPLPDRRRLLLCVRVARPAARARPARRRGDLGARVPARTASTRGGAARRDARARGTAHRGGERRLRRRVRPRRRAPLPPGREREGDSAGPGAAALPEAPGRPQGPRGRPGDRHEPRRRARGRVGPRGRAHARVPRGADAGSREGRRRLRRLGERRLPLPGLPARLRRRREPLQAPGAPGAARRAGLRARRRSARPGGAPPRDPLPWARKGTVMRVLAEEMKDERTDPLDGIKVFFDSGWAQVLPDPAEPLVHVYAEGASEQESRDLEEKYATLVETAIAGESDGGEAQNPQVEVEG